MVGREKEIETINALCEADKSSLAVIYGRRRIGKTYLVDYMFQSHRKDCLFFKFTGSADQDSQVQKDYFVEAIYDWFKAQPIKPITKWHEAFIFLKRTIENQVSQKDHKGKVIVFIDEVAWIDRHNKAGFLSAFGHFYNTYIEKHDNLVVILCGSNASWIKNKILKDSKGPLFHRVDVEVPLQPFDLKETKEYLLKEKKFDLDDKSVVDIYMSLGGVAKYLSYLDAKLSVAQNINKLFFSLHAALFGEFDMLFKSLFYDKASSHKKIVELLVANQKGYTAQELEAHIKNTSPSTLRTNLEELVDTGFIKPVKRFNYTAKNTKYIAIDPFCNFYNRWVEPLSKNDIANLVDYFQTKSLSPDYVIWQGYAFEKVMMANIHLYLKKRGLSAAIESIGYWNYSVEDSSSGDKGAQIDILIGYKGGVYDIVECKYYNDEFSIDKEDAQNLKNKKQKLIEHELTNKKYDLKVVMLTTYGTKVNRYYNDVPVAKELSVGDLLS